MSCSLSWWLSVGTVCLPLRGVVFKANAVNIFSTTPIRLLKEWNGSPVNAFVRQLSQVPWSIACGIAMVIRQKCSFSYSDGAGIYAGYTRHWVWTVVSTSGQTLAMRRDIFRHVPNGWKLYVRLVFLNLTTHIHQWDSECIGQHRPSVHHGNGECHTTNFDGK